MQSFIDITTYYLQDTPIEREPISLTSRVETRAKWPFLAFTYYEHRFLFNEAMNIHSPKEFTPSPMNRNHIICSRMKQASSFSIPT